MSPLLVLVPLRIEELALGRIPGARVLRAGIGPRRARVAAARAQALDARSVAVAGLCAGVRAGLRPGEAVCASALIGEDGTETALPGSALLAAALRRHGLSVHEGPLYSAGRILGPAERFALPAEILGVDMESAWLASAAAGRPFAVVRVIVDRAGRRLADPRLVLEGPRALRSLRRVAPALAEWGAAAESHETDTGSAPAGRRPVSASERRAELPAQ